MGGWNAACKGHRLVASLSTSLSAATAMHTCNFALSCCINLQSYNHTRQLFSIKQGSSHCIRILGQRLGLTLTRTPPRYTIVFFQEFKQRVSFNQTTGTIHRPGHREPFKKRCNTLVSPAQQPCTCTLDIRHEAAPHTSSRAGAIILTANGTQCTLQVCQSPLLHRHHLRLRRCTAPLSRQ